MHRFIIEDDMRSIKHTLTKEEIKKLKKWYEWYKKEIRVEKPGGSMTQNEN